MIWRRIRAAVWLVALLPAAMADGTARAGAEALEYQEPQEPLCASLERPPADLARQLAHLGETGRTALIALASSREGNEVLCGVAGLSALGDRRVIPHLVAALRNPAMRNEARLVARWAAFLAGGREPDLGTAMLEVVEAFGDQALWDAAGHDAIWFLGEVDHPAARARLLVELDRPLNEAGQDAVVHALARQGDARARSRIGALGVEAALAKSGNATPEQARRLGAVAFYQLALGPETMAEGLVTLGTIAARDQADAAAWAVHTLCERAVRRPTERPAIEAHRLALVDELDRLGVSWDAVKGNFGCSASAGFVLLDAGQPPVELP